MALVAGAGVVACFELSGLPSQLSSISSIRLAWPAVVVGDVLRDENGDPAPLQVEAYDGSGQVVTDATVAYVVRDRGLHIDANGVVYGDSARASPVRVIAQVRRGSDILQTPDQSIDVVLLPDTITPARDTTFASKSVPLDDANPISSDALTVKVMHRVPGGTPTAVKSWIVRYDILNQLPGAGGQRTAVFEGGADTVAFDTTDGTGAADRKISLRRVLLVPGSEQSIMVRATARRIGAANETRTVVFTLPFVGQ